MSLDQLIQIICLDAVVAVAAYLLGLIFPVHWVEKLLDGPAERSWLLVVAPGVGSLLLMVLSTVPDLAYLARRLGLS